MCVCVCVSLPGAALRLVIDLQYLLDLVDAAMDGVVQDTGHHQALYLLSIDVQLLAKHTHTASFITLYPLSLPILQTLFHSCACIW